MDKLDNLIKICENKLKSGNANYLNTVECDFLLRELLLIKKELTNV